MAKLERAGFGSVQRLQTVDPSVYGVQARAAQNMASTIGQAAGVIAATVTEDQMSNAATSAQQDIANFDMDYGQMEEFTPDQVRSFGLAPELEDELLASGEPVPAHMVYPAALRAHIDRTTEERAKGITSPIHRKRWTADMAESATRMEAKATEQALVTRKRYQAKKDDAAFEAALDAQDYEGAQQIAKYHVLPERREELREAALDRQENDYYTDILTNGTPDQMRAAAESVRTDYSGRMNPDQQRAMIKDLKNQANIREAELDRELMHAKGWEKSNLDIRIDRGQATYSDIDRAYVTNDNKFGYTAAWRASAYAKLDNLNQQMMDYSLIDQYVSDSLAGNPTLLDSTDPDHRKVMDMRYDRDMEGLQGDANAMAQYTVEFASRTGYLPKTMRVKFGNIHNDGIPDQEVVVSSALFEELSMKAPKAIANVSDRNKLFMTAVNNSVKGSGNTIGPDSLSNLRRMFGGTRQDVVERRTKDFDTWALNRNKKSGVTNINQALMDRVANDDSGWFGSVMGYVPGYKGIRSAIFGDETPGTTTPMQLDFENRVKELYILAGDDAGMQMDDILDAAYIDIKNQYQTTEMNGVPQLARNAPEYAYGLQPEQVQKDLIRQAKALGVEGELELIADHVTARGGDKPTYGVALRKPDGTLDFIEYNDGTPWRYTPNTKAIAQTERDEKARKRALEENRAAFERAGKKMSLEQRTQRKRGVPDPFGVRDRKTQPKEEETVRGNSRQAAEQRFKQEQERRRREGADLLDNVGTTR